MLINYIKIAFKVLLRRKFFTAISLFGIAFTLTTILVCTALVDYTLSPQSPEINLDRTLHLTRLLLKMEADNGTRHWWGAPGYQFLDRYCRDLPGVQKMSVYSAGQQVISFVNDRKIISTARYTDGPYWEILDFNFLEGGPFMQQDERAGNRVAVISEATRKQFFGEVLALDKRIEFDGLGYRVVGVVENIDPLRLPAVADIWAPHSSRKLQDFRHEFVSDYSGLLLADSAAEFPQIKAEFQSRLLHTEFPENVKKINGIPMTRLEMLAPITSEEAFANPPVHLLIWEFVGGLLLFMLLPAINLIALNMSRIFERSSEIGVRKAFGASTAHLVGQFILENVFLCLTGSMIALAFAYVVLELIENWGFIPYLDLTLNIRVFLHALVLACLLGVLSGALPAWRMSRLHPVQALRGGIR